ncbi:hypothetical protein [Neobacillus bataviensis]|nr:hypothetical protein [Neobacillus bataviensis]
MISGTYIIQTVPFPRGLVNNPSFDANIAFLLASTYCCPLFFCDPVAPPLTINRAKEKSNHLSVRHSVLEFF